MSSHPVRQPGPDHPITIELAQGHVTVTAGGRTIVDSRRALRLSEASYPPVLYVPREDADMSLLERSETSSYCPYKGEASYYSIPAGGSRSDDAIWSYEHPHAAMAGIAGHLAFYPNRVDAIRCEED